MLAAPPQKLHSHSRLSPQMIGPSNIQYCMNHIPTQISDIAHDRGSFSTGVLNTDSADGKSFSVGINLPAYRYTMVLKLMHPAPFATKALLLTVC